MLPILVAMARAAASLTSTNNFIGAIFDDIRLNAMIGNGNDAMSMEWVTGKQGEEVKLVIASLDCQEERRRANCVFAIKRTSTREKEATLFCTAAFRKDDEGWSVVHSPPPKQRGHSVTSMTCRADKEYRL